MGRGRWLVASGLSVVFLALAVMTAAVVAVAQEPGKQKEGGAKADPPKAALPKVAAPATKQPAAGGFRKLAPGVIVTIPIEKQNAELVETHDLHRILAKVETYGERPNPNKPGELAVKNLAKGVRLPRNVWACEFNFKPMRMIDVDVPRPGEKFDRKKIWYMVYFVRYLPAPQDKPKAGEQPKEGDAPKAEGDAPKAEGDAPKAEAEGAAANNALPKAVKFLPRFMLFSDQTTKSRDGREIPKAYADRLIPVAMDPIRLREDPRRKLLDSVEISEKLIPMSTETEDHPVWGVATWEDIDPKTCWFTVYVQGLTNSYKIEPITEKDAEGKETKRWQYLRKTLVLNFWRPGDEYDETDREIRFGGPGKVEHTWEFK